MFFGVKCTERERERGGGGWGGAREEDIERERAVCEKKIKRTT